MIINQGSGDMSENREEMSRWCNGARLASQARYNEALALIDQSLEENGLDPELLVQKALTLDRIGFFSASIACCEQAIALEPRNCNAWFVRGLTLYYLARNTDAMICLDQAVAIDPDHCEAWFIKGNC